MTSFFARLKKHAIPKKVYMFWYEMEKEKKDISRLNSLIPRNVLRQENKKTEFSEYIEKQIKEY